MYPVVHYRSRGRPLVRFERHIGLTNFGHTRANQIIPRAGGRMESKSPLGPPPDPQRCKLSSDRDSDR